MSDTTNNTGAECCGPMGCTEAHERLKPFEGTFAAEVRMWVGPGDPHVSTGVMVNPRPALSATPKTAPKSNKNNCLVIYTPARRAA